MSIISNTIGLLITPYNMKMASAATRFFNLSVFSKKLSKTEELTADTPLQKISSSNSYA